MDSQFNTLVRSYHDNFLEHRVTGEDRYQTSYEGAREGIENILKTMNDDVQNKQKELADFYRSGVRDNLRDLKLSLAEQNDIQIAAQKRQEGKSALSPSLRWQYIGLGVLGVATLGILAL
jgi:hypothetical protein